MKQARSNVARRAAVHGFSMLALGALLAGCGGGTDRMPPAAGARSGGTAAARDPASAGHASAAEVAQEARGKVKCPAKIKSAARPADAPVDDVVGVRPGMTYEEAANVVMCTHELLVVSEDSSRRFQIQTYGQTLRQGFSARFAKERVQKTSRQIMQELQDSAMARGTNRVVRDMQPGEAKWYVTTMGLPGQERVISAAREEWFEAGRNPTLASIEQALVKKYGQPTESPPRTQHNKSLSWAYDTRQRPITESSPLYGRCRGMADPDGGTSYSPDCGLVVTAVVHALRDNPDLAEYMQVGVIDQAGGYEALTGTEQALQQMDRQRRAREVEAASEHADAPTL